jgi:NTE family protein
VALHSLTLLISQRRINEVTGLGAAVTIKILPKLCPLAVSAADFRRAAQLIARARRTSLEWIGSGEIDLPHPEGFLALHDHGARPGTDRAAPDPAARLSNRPVAA